MVQETRPHDGQNDALLEIDVASSTVTYIGAAARGVSSSEASWKIQRHTSTAGGSLSIQWADGDNNFDNIWDNRASLTYS